MLEFLVMAMVKVRFKNLSTLVLLLFLLFGTWNPARAQIRCVDNDEGINTAIGCIPFGSSQGLAVFLLTWGIGIAGGVALILIAYAGFLVITSQGDPQRLNAGKELLTAAISGLVMIVMSAFILRFIAEDLLQIPGLGG